MQQSISIGIAVTALVVEIETKRLTVPFTKHSHLSKYNFDFPIVSVSLLVCVCVCGWCRFRMDSKVVQCRSHKKQYVMFIKASKVLIKRVASAVEPKPENHTAKYQDFVTITLWMLRKIIAIGFLQISTRNFRVVVAENTMQ